MCDHKFLFSYNNTYLTDAQREFYEENGYLLIRNLVDQSLLKDCKERLKDICNGKVKSNMRLVKDLSLRKENVTGEYLFHKAEDLCSDEILCKFVYYNPIVNIVESIIGPNITASRSLAFNKPPNAAFHTSRQATHQDVYYSPFRPIKCIVTVWTALEKIEEQNGCLYFIPGSHKLNKIFPHIYTEGMNSVGHREVDNFQLSPKLYLPMEIGDTIFIHPLVLHGSGPNRTKGFRRALTTHYCDSNSIFIDLGGTVQEPLAKEMAKALNVKDYKDHWTSISRVVRGEPGNFQKMASSL